MSFSFNSYEEFGRRFSTSDDETELRNSVSRGYYCFYHKVRNFFGVVDSVYKTHEELTLMLKDERLKKGAYLSNSMLSMKQERVQADYYLRNLPNITKIDFNKSSVAYFWQRYDALVKLLEEEKSNLY